MLTTLGARVHRRFILAHHPVHPDNPAMTPDPIFGRRLFVDGIVRPVFANDAGA
jgi:hypothetical protein